VGSIARAGVVEKGHDQAGGITVSSYPTRRLDVLRRALGLADEDDQAQPLDVDSDLNQIGRDDAVECPLWPPTLVIVRQEAALERIEDGLPFVSTDARKKSPLDRTPRRTTPSSASTRSRR